MSAVIISTQFTVRYAEVDAMGIVHHRNYITYLEEGRSEYARQRGFPYSQFEAQGFFLLVSEVHIRHIKPAHYEQSISVNTWITEMKSRGMTFEYTVTDTQTGEILATAQTKHICITKAGQIAKMPQTWRDWHQPDDKNTP
ncbi:MAG: acyl-CoA thioesterase [Anaerolineae bacterium]|jgi:acyl-CoA thioester hydrolase|nr:acyl-CoA thioesterase [Anaerolineae bacterium]